MNNSYYKVMTFQPNGIPTALEHCKHDSREDAEERMKEFKGKYNIPMFVSEFNTK